MLPIRLLQNPLIWNRSGERRMPRRNSFRAPKFPMISALQQAYQWSYCPLITIFFARKEKAFNDTSMHTHYWSNWKYTKYTHLSRNLKIKNYFLTDLFRRKLIFYIPSGSRTTKSKKKLSLLNFLNYREIYTSSQMLLWRNDFSSYRDSLSELNFLKLSSTQTSIDLLPKVSTVSSLFPISVKIRL